jgi:hypothetical protein
MASFISNLCSYGEIILWPVVDWRYEGKSAIRRGISWNGMMKTDVVKYYKICEI